MNVISQLRMPCPLHHQIHIPPSLESTFTNYPIIIINNHHTEIWKQNSFTGKIFWGILRLYLINTLDCTFHWLKGANLKPARSQEKIKKIRGNSKAQFHYQRTSLTLILCKMKLKNSQWASLGRNYRAQRSRKTSHWKNNFLFYSA